MAWRRYPEYQKKEKTYKNYTHLTYQEIKIEKNNEKFKQTDKLLEIIEVL